jgi:hypothetical protein
MDSSQNYKMQTKLALRRCAVRRSLLALLSASLLICRGFLFATMEPWLYDMTTEISLNGTVTDWTFESPYSWLWLNVQLPQGVRAEWSIESAAPIYLARQGWSESTLKPDENITVVISPLKHASKRGILLEVKRSNGEDLIVGSGARSASLPARTRP